MATAKSVLSAGAKLAGENEAVVGQNNTTINKAYPGFVGLPYCGKFVQWCMEQAGCSLLKGCSNPAYVPILRQYMDSKGWRVNTPKAGDIFVEGNDMHTGYVYEGLTYGNFITLEGNYGHVFASATEAKTENGFTFEGIGYRRATVSEKFKFYRPPYDSASNSEVATSTTQTTKVGAAFTIQLHELDTGCMGAEVKNVQRILSARGCTGADGKPVDVDGKYGPNTKAAVKKLQIQLFPSQTAEQDGIWGAKTALAAFTKLD